MKAKKLICTVLCIVMVFALAVPAFAAKPTTSTFTDTKGNWAEHEIALVADAGIVGGYPDGSFRPNAYISREAFAKVVSNFMGYTEEADLSQYKDVNPNDGLTPYVARCVAQGVMGGFSDTRMAPKNNITREQAAAMLCRAFKLNTEGLTGKFVDKNLITEKLRPEVAALELTGLIGGYDDGTFRPKANLTRAQMMAIISRLLPDNSGYFSRITANSGSVALTADMLNDYSSEFFIPAGNVTAEAVDFTVKVEQLPEIKGMSTAMQKLISAAISGKEITDTVETGYSETFNPKEIFPAAYEFNFSTLIATINGDSCTINAYGREAENGTKIVLTPINYDKTNTAMQHIMNVENIAFNLIPAADSINLAKGSYIQVGTEMVCIKDSIGDLLIDLTKDEMAITEDVINSLVLKTGVKSDGNQATVVIKAGTKITVEGISIALAKDITVHVNGLSEDYNGILSTLAYADVTNIDMLVGLANDFVRNTDGRVVYIDATLK